MLATVLNRSHHFGYTPLWILLHERFIPLGGFGELQNGAELFDLLLTNRDDLAEAVELLERFIPIKINIISRRFQYYIILSVTE